MMKSKPSLILITSLYVGSAIIFVAIFLLFSCSKDYSPVTLHDTITDIDGNTYRTVKIGNQWWMAENLKVTHYRNSDAIHNVANDSVWANLTTGAYCKFNNNERNATTYGRLYNWYAVNDSRNIAPSGWHVPSEAEWRELEMYLGMSQSEADTVGWRGTDEGGKLKETGTTYWHNPNTGATNESGFSALPGGKRSYNGHYYVNNIGSYSNIGSCAVFWSSTENNSYARGRYLDIVHSKIYRSNGTYKNHGYSVRCVKN